MSRDCSRRGCNTQLRKKYARICSRCRNLSASRLTKKSQKYKQRSSKGIKSSKQMKHIDNPGGSALRCGCKNWIKHYKNNKKRNMPRTCAAHDCKTKPEHGAHVKKIGTKDHKWYIIPTCNGHNRGKKNTFFPDNREIVSIHKQKGCKSN